MNIKEKKLIHLLIENSPTTASTLAENLNMSVRTIKNYVHNINNEFPNIITSSNEGYHIDLDKINYVLENENSNIPQASNERVVYIINKLLSNSNQEAVDIFNLCEELFISYSTLRNELNKIKRRLHNYDLMLVTKKDTISIKGLEKNKRKMLSSILYDESNINFVNLQSIQNSFIDINIEFIKDTVLYTFDKYHYYINDYSLINLVLHITIAIDRIRNNNYNDQQINKLPGVHLHEFELATNVARKLEEYFQIKYSEAEIYEMTLLIISRASNINYETLNTSNLDKFINVETLELVNYLLEEIKSLYYIDLGEQEFFIRFALHIQNLLVRSKNNYFNKNPLTEGIKTSCPLIYDLSVNIAQTIKKLTNITINDDEIAYIAFHLGSTLEAQKNLSEKITAILYCPNYYDLNQRITETINKHFSNDLLITNIITDESEIYKIENNDLIITTIPLAMLSATPVIIINLFINEKDRHAISEKIIELYKQKKRKVFEKYLRELIIPEFFEHTNIIKDKDQCINYLVDKFKNKNYINDSFKDEIYEREQMSSTAYNNFAIPHTMQMNAKNTGINILICEEGILWDNQNVYLVIMMCFNQHKRYIFNEIYDPLTIILSETKNIKKIVCCNSYDSFIENLTNLL